MTLKQIIGTIKKLATKHPNVNSTYEGNIYDILNANPSNKYASVVLTQTTHTQDEMFDHYGFVIFYVDRLIDDVEDNRVQIQSIGKSMLTNIVEAFCYEFDAEHNDITFHPFTQKFADETAGVYIDIVIDTPKDSICAERYWDEQWSAPIITIKNATEEIYITENGHFEVTYDPTNYTGLEKVIIDVEFDTNPYFQEGYNNGYDVGHNEGYDYGFANGVEEQKNKLESITITENGTYSREDGYNEVIVDVPDTNGSYDEGYSDGYINGDGDGYNRGYTEGEANGVENAGEIIAQTAQVLNITENGNYLTQYSDPFIPTDITGYFDDGTPFYGSAELVNIVYYTDIIGTADSYFEVWWKDLQNYSLDHSAIVGLEQNGCIFKVSKRNTGENSFAAQYGTSSLNVKEYNFNYDMSDWTHIKFSREGLYINGERMNFDFQFDFTNPNSAKFQINDVENGRYANGVFGMVKIDDQIFIPTEEGFKNYSTGEMLEFYKEGMGSYKYIINDPIYGEGNLIKTVNVNVVPKINVEEAGIKFSYSTFNEIPEWFVFEGITDMSRMFYGCSNLTSIPLIDTSNVTNMYYMLRECSNLTSVSNFNTSNVTNMGFMFYGCSNLTSVPNFNTSNVTSMEAMFENCGKITTIPELDTSKVNNVRRMFYGCSNLTSVPPLNAQNITSNEMFGFSELTKLTDFGGLIGLKVNFNGSYSFNKCPNLTYQSCINILNGLYDFTGNGETPSSNQGQLKVHQNFIDTVGDEISIATNKGWQITA